jgi:AcrR family transcriptional regulator
MSVIPEKPLRKDAERNRQRILAAAAEVFAERGLGVSLDDVAARAGVGVGTVYRRFADKDALIDALFEEKLSAIERLAHESMAVEDPWEAFSGFMRALCRVQAEDRGLKEALLMRDRGTVRLQQMRDTIAPVAAELLARAQAAGEVRADLGTFDVPLMHFAVGFIAEKTSEESPRYWERAMTVMLDGIRARRDDVTPMPSPPLSREQFVAAMTRKTAAARHRSRTQT